MSIDFSSLNGDLLSQAETLLRAWLPGGKLHGREYKCGNLQGAEGDSLSVNIRTGMWADFATDRKGGDLISLYAAIHGMGQADAARELGAEETRFRPVAPVEKKAPEPEPEAELEIPPPGEKSTCFHIRWGKPVRVWEYKNESGVLIGYVARYEPDGKKQFIPWRWISGEWRQKHFPAPRPIYGLDKIAARPKAHVIICEGEKAADAAAQIVPQSICISWPGGAKSWEKVDWSPLTGRKVILWPDNDEAGISCMVGIHEWLETTCESVTRLDPTGQTPKWDAADALAEGMDSAKFKEWAQSRVVKPVPETKNDARAEPQRVPEAHGNGKPENPYRAVETGGSRGSVPPDGSRIEAEQAGTGTHGKPVSLAAERQKRKKPAKAPLPAFWQTKSWASEIVQTANGTAQAIHANAMTCLRRDDAWKGVILFDEFRQQMIIGKENEFDLPVRSQWRDYYDGVVTEWMQRMGIAVSLDKVATAVQCIAAENTINTLHDHLNALEWDGETRIGRWLVDYCKAEESEFTNAAGRMWMIGAVSRAFAPGRKFDNVLLLEGKQGIGKSTAFNILGGEFFTDDMPDMHKTDAKGSLIGAWIFELGELSAIRKQDAELIKSFITRTTDRYRTPYAKHHVEHPRTVAFCGTTNEDEYLKDTHNRRFWPVLIHEVDTDRLRKDRDQLWAEAIHCYRAGEQWHMPDELIPHAEKAQASRRTIDMWEEYTLKYITHSANFAHVDDVEPSWIERETPLTWMKTDFVLRDVFKLPPKDWADGPKGRIGKILKANGWTKEDWPKKNCYRSPEWNGEKE